jgi:hypothetical protein
VLDDRRRIISARNLEETIAEMIEHAADDSNQPPELRRAHAIANEAQTKLDRYMDAVEKPMDPTLYVERSRTAQRELAAARTLFDGHSESDEVPLTEHQLGDWWSASATSSVPCGTPTRTSGGTS